jgi:hypothetical protein
MAYEKYIPQMSLTLDRYTLTQDFYVVDILDTNIILGVQCLNTLGPITTNHKSMEMSFNSEEGKRVTLKGIIENAPRVVSTKCMEEMFRHGDVDYATKCLVVTQPTHYKSQHYPVDIHRIINKHGKVFG